MLNKKNKYIDVDMHDLGLYVRSPVKFYYFDYDGARRTANYPNGFIITKNVLQSDLLQGLYGKQKS